MVEGEFAPVADCWFLTGPTASGKTRVGIALAKLLDAEILSMDSMAVYRDMDIGTAKPTALERAEVRHHLLDLATPDQEFSISQYMAAAVAAVAEVQGRGRKVLFVGGTPLYLKALLRGLSEGPAADWDFRESIEREIRETGLEALHERLRQVDPLAAARLHPNDKRRIIRALEVNRLTGRPLSHSQTHFDEPVGGVGNRVFTLHWARERLHRRIESRVEQMFAAGLVNEAAGLRVRYGTLGRTASQAVGYREAFGHLDGRLSLAEAIMRVQVRTRQFARRQETWFRGLAECQPVALADDEAPLAIAQRIIDGALSDQASGAL
ncbi:MAG: tRNA (adenosine(37)-N6)-dimethylallyltransferase MiaA [Planctomycetota bacterium]